MPEGSRVSCTSRLRTRRIDFIICSETVRLYCAALRIDHRRRITGRYDRQTKIAWFYLHLCIPISDQTVTIRDASMPRWSEPSTKSLIVSGKVTLRSFAQNAAAPSRLAGNTGGERGNKRAATGQSGRAGLQGVQERPVATTSLRARVAFLIDVADITFRSRRLACDFREW